MGKPQDIKNRTKLWDSSSKKFYKSIRDEEYDIKDMDEGTFRNRGREEVTVTRDDRDDETDDKGCCTEKRREFFIAVIVCIAGCFSTSYTQTYLFSYLPEMTLWFGYDERDKGFYAGFVASCYFVGNGLSGYMWGRLSDTKGKKITLIATLLGNGVCCLVFAFSVNFYMALALRFATGLANGSFQICKAIIYHSTDSSNTAIGLSFTSVGFAVGISIGPALGGFLADPAVKFPHTFSPTGLFARMPYILPSLMCAGAAFIAALLVAVLYKETTKPSFEYETLKEDTEISNPDENRDVTTYGALSETYTSDAEADCQAAPVCLDDRQYKMPHVRPQIESHILSQRYYEDEKVKEKRCTKLANAAKNTNIFKLLKTSHVCRIVIISSFYAASVLATYELIPVWTSTVKGLGGLAFTSSDIGLIYSISTFPGIGMELILMPLSERRNGAIKTFCGSVMFIAIIISMLPLARYLSPTNAWVSVITFQFLYEMCISSCYATLAIISNNCVRGQDVGAMNGLVTMVGAWTRSISPIVGGNLFVLSITSSVGPPIDPSFAFVVFGILFWLCSILVYFLPDYLNKRRATRDSD